MRKRRLNFRDKLLVFGITLTVCPLLLFAAVVWRQNQQLRAAASESYLRATQADVDHTAENIYRMCEHSRATLERTVRENLHSARELLEQAGGIQTDGGEP
ncbi:MAG: hypothetical protein JO336_07365, partial [Acidobacteriia bacterium]|nr:hypothetical protein [Terriglobia bacterium]